MSALAFPVTATADAFAFDVERREGYARWLDSECDAVAAMIELARETDLLSETEVTGALDALESCDDAEPLYRLMDLAQAQLAAHLQNRAVGLGVQSQAPFLLISAEAESEQGLVAVRACDMTAASLPFGDLRADVARLCVHACRWIVRQLNVDVTWFWTMDNGAWWLAERVDLYEALPESVRADPVAFWEVCCEDGTFSDGAESVEDAAALSATLSGCYQGKERIASLLAAAGPEPNDPETLGREARELSAALPDTSPDRLWCEWTGRVADLAVAAKMREVVNPAPLEDGIWPIDCMIQIDPGAPWWNEAAAELWEHSMNADEPFLRRFAWAPGRGAAILAALENVVDAMSLLWTAPAVGEPPCLGETCDGNM